MTGWLLRRIAQAAVVVFLMTLIVFVGLHAIGNPVDILIGQDVDQVDRARIIAELGLDKPLWQQYLGFLNGALHGNLGNSFVYNIPAVELVIQRLPATFELAIAAMLLAVLIGLPLGLLAGLYPDSRYSKLIMAGSIVGFAAHLLDRVDAHHDLQRVAGLAAGQRPRADGGVAGLPMVLADRRRLASPDPAGLQPVAVQDLAGHPPDARRRARRAAAGLRQVRPRQGPVAGSRGGRARAAQHHDPAGDGAGPELGSTIAFAVVTESIFAWPGAGKLILDSLNALDRPVIVAYLIVVVCLFVTLNLIVDILYKVLDPRVRGWRPRHERGIDPTPTPALRRESPGAATWPSSCRPRPLSSAWSYRCC